MKDPYHIWKTAIGVTRWIGSPTSIIAHTIAFGGAFVAVAEGFIEWDHMLLLLTTIVSLEAIYLAIFIQMTINYTTHELREVGEDIEEMQEDIGELQEDVEEITEDIGEFTEDEESEEQAEERRKAEQKKTLTDIQSDLRKLMDDIAELKKNPPPTA
jgi:biopolymer transport protein ExbB/TolQ